MLPPPIERRQYPRLSLRPQDRYADGRESRKILAALAGDVLAVVEIARRARKDIDATKALICALRRQGKITVDHRAWVQIRHKDGHARRRQIAYYRADNSMTSAPESATMPHGLSA